MLFRKRGLGYVVLLTLLVALGVGGAFAVIEGLDIFEGMWWAIVTLTTVGYGDVYPVTIEGRIAAAVLMLVGIGFFAFITASVAAHFVSDDEDDLVHKVDRLGERLEGIEATLARLASDSSNDQPSD